MGLDIGDRTIGIALSDESALMAFPAENYRRVSVKKDVDHLVDLMVHNGILEVVAGMPYNMNGSIGPQAEKTQQFIASLEKKLRHTDRLDRRIPVSIWDERLTSKAAERDLITADMRRDKRKQEIDMVAAALILQGYLDHKRNGGQTL